MPLYRASTPVETAQRNFCPACVQTSTIDVQRSHTGGADVFLLGREGRS